jgi:DNA-binding transcriptional regulator/RsmH inhibitor MraZ
MKIITGETVSPIDKYGRIRIPSKWIEIFTDNTLVIRKEMYPYPHLQLYSEEVFSRFAESVFGERGYSPRSQEDVLTRTALYEDTEQIQIDTRNRITIPMRFRKMLIDEDSRNCTLVLTAVRDHIIICGPEARVRDEINLFDSL